MIWPNLNHLLLRISTTIQSKLEHPKCYNLANTHELNYKKNRSVLWRRGNKVVISTPLLVAEDAGDEKRAGFVLEFGAIRAGFETKDFQPQPTNVYIPVFISLGII